MSEKNCLHYGDVVWVRRNLHKVFAIWAAGYGFILFGNDGKTRCVHVESKEKFLRGNSKYTVCRFPAKYGRSVERTIHRPGWSGFVTPMAQKSLPNVWSFTGSSRLITDTLQRRQWEGQKANWDRPANGQVNILPYGVKQESLNLISCRI